MNPLRAVCSFVVALVLVLPGEPAIADPMRLDFVGCRTQFAAYPVPGAVLATMLPEGFRPNPFSVLPTGDVGSVPLYVQRCERIAADGATIAEDTLQAWLAIWVQPPDEWRSPSVEAYYWVVRAFVPAASLADVYDRWGVGPAEASTVQTGRLPSDLAEGADVAYVRGASANITMSNIDSAGFTPWAGLRARFFGRGTDGDIHAADHMDAAGSQISRIQPSTVIGDAGAAPLVGLQAGLGRTFRASWSFQLVA